LASGLAFRTIIAYYLPAGFDESYYFLYTQHLNWSYFDHPPAVAWSTGFGVWLTGNVSPFTIRLGSLGLFTASLVLMFATGKQLFGSRAGLLSCAIASLAPLFFLSFGTLTAPDNALIFCWSVALYLCALEFFPTPPFNQALSYQPTYRLALIATAIGFTCLSKYHGFLLGLSLVCFCASQRQYRQALTSKWFCLGLVLFATTQLPVLYWNSQHDWISFRFQLGDRFTAYGDQTHDYSWSALLGAFSAQIGYLFPSIALPIWWVSLKATFSQLRQRLFGYQRYFVRLSKPTEYLSTRITFLLWSGLPVALGFTLLAGATHTFPAWPAPGLWSLTLLLGYSASRWRHTSVRKWFSITSWSIGILLMFALSHITIGTLQQEGDHAIGHGFVAIETDPSTELIDAVQLRQVLVESEVFERATASADFIVTPEFWLSGYIAMALPPSYHLPVTSFTPDPRGHAFWFKPANWIGKDALLISAKKQEITETANRQGGVIIAPSTQPHNENIGAYFQSLTPITEIATQRGGEISKVFYLYSAKNLLWPYPYTY
ncbi:MAG: glycosyltransferase family 39 protein, partial [Cyanobacteria bacterium J06649_4]